MVTIEENSLESEGKEDFGQDNVSYNSALFHLEKLISDHLNGNIEIACEAVRNVKMLLVFESKLQEH